MKIQLFYEDPQTLHVGTEENRAYYMPFVQTKDDRCKMLSGADWKFKFYENHYEVPEDFMQGKCSSFDTIAVPSCWNILGYEKNQYANIECPIPFDPPYVPDENSCGAYVKTFEMTKQDLSMRSYLNFEGVDSCFYLWLNARFVGYSQVSHSTSEFDITDYLKEGTNTLSVLVLKWCDGTYLEDQDKLRMSGIFRDVYILQRSQNFIKDYTVKTDIQADTAQVSVQVEWHGKPQTFTATLIAPDGIKINTKTVESTEIAFTVDNPLLWNSETPYLYTVILSTSDESIAQKIGLKKVEIKKSVFYINGQNVKFKGVNRHDSNAYTGYTISRDQLMRDLKLMKEHNINAIRTSHYPNAPWALDLYSEYGFYVIDEADIESHMTVTIYGGGCECDYFKKIANDHTYGLMSHDARFEKAMLDRVQRCVIRDKNAACVVMWSLGNESGYGPNMEKAAKWIKEFDKNSIIHYESSINQMPGYTNDVSNIDVYSRMYQDCVAVKNYCEKSPKRPLVLCEFVHAMGNGPGDIEDYFELVYKYDCFAGGFVWEWCDHSVYMGKTKEGKDKFYYGGDFGEFPHAGNFCMDGLIYPDRRPHTGLFEYQNVARPVRASLVKEGIFELYNTLNFTDTKDALKIVYDVVKDDKVIDSGELQGLSILPHERKQVKVDYHVDKDSDFYIMFKYLQKTETEFVREGHCLGFDQIMLSKRTPKAIEPVSGSIDVIESDTSICIAGEHFKYTFDKRKGTAKELVYKNVPYLCKPIEYNIWRAPIDNDRNIRNEWQKAGYERKTVKVYDTQITKEKNSVLINFDFSFAAIFIQRILEGKSQWRIFADGRIELTIEAKRNIKMPYLPRFGVRLFMPESFKSVTYKGYGPHESYCDKHRASYYASFSSTVTDLHEDYITPQENGSHFCCTNVHICDEGTACGDNKLSVQGENFSFNASCYTQEHLDETAHNFDLVPSGFTVLCLDSHMSGVGSNSCGPKLLEQYRVNNENLILRMELKPGE